MSERASFDATGAGGTYGMSYGQMAAVSIDEDGSGRHFSSPSSLGRSYGLAAVVSLMLWGVIVTAVWAMT
jgi:hypothetical protein